MGIRNSSFGDTSDIMTKHLRKRIFQNSTLFPRETGATVVEEKLAIDCLTDIDELVFSAEQLARTVPASHGASPRWIARDWDEVKCLQ
jgi:hypothetical protein